MLLVDEFREAWQTDPREHRIALAVIFVIAFALRLRHLGQPMRYDEAVTYLYFVRHPWAEALSSYTYPNNHLFHTLLAKAAVTAFGNAPWALRLPAFIAGLLVVVATYPVVRAFYGARAGLLATAIVASSGVLTLYSVNARGYSLLVFAFLLLCLAAIRAMRAPSTARWIAVGVIGAFGLWTVPVMLYPLGSVCLWIVLSLLIDERGSELRGLWLALGVCALVTGLLYAPVVAHAGLSAVIRNRFVVSSGWFEFFEQLPSTIREAFASWSLGVHPTLRWALLLFAAVALWRHASLTRFRVSFVVAAYAWCAWLLVVNHRAPFPRVWLWVVPVVAGLAAAGFLRLLADRGGDRLVDRRIPIAAVAFALVTALSVAWTRQVFLSRDTGTYRDAEQAATVLRRFLQPGDRILVAIPSNASLAYYLDRDGVPETYLTLDEQRARRILVVVNPEEGQSLESVVANSDVRDQQLFGPPATLARLPNSSIVFFPRRDAPPK